MSVDASEPGGPIEREIAAMYDRGRAAWPGVELARRAFADFVTPQLTPQGAGDRLDAAGLYLACACAAQEPRALAELERGYIATLDPALSSLERSGVPADDVKQLLRVRFLVGADGRPPRIAEYSGAGDLRAWLRVAAVRIGISLQRQHRREDLDADEALGALAAAGAGPELDLMKETYRTEFAAAFRVAVAGMEPRERNLLRHQIHDQLSIDKIGALYGVHRATAARWVTRARERLIDGIRSELQAQLAVDRDQLDSILRLIQSQLDVSLRVFLTDD